jgi:hypothetical protein
MILTTKGLQESIANGWPVQALAMIHHPVPAVTSVWADGFLRLWDGVGDLRYGGQPWRGIGPFGRLAGIGGSKRLMIRTVTFELVGIPANYAVYLDPALRNRSAKAWIAGMDRHGAKVNGDPYLEVDGLCDYQESESEDGLTQVIRLIVGEPVYSIERAQTLAYTPEWANSYLRKWRERNIGGARITGYDRISELADATRSWTPT